MKNNNKLTFEEALSELEKISKKVEDSNLSLDELVQAFDEGMKLSNICKNKLNSAKLKIKNIIDIENNKE